MIENEYDSAFQGRDASPTCEEERSREEEEHENRSDFH